MLKFPSNISEARILISNDDSIHSEGIKVLEEIARAISPNVWVVAPETQQSAAGHSLTVRMPLRMKVYNERRVSVSGTPTDSVLMGVRKVMKDFRPHIVLSGINHGPNTADDVTYSGTVAAAIEATLMGIPSIAFSQDMDEENGWKPDWAIAREYLPKILNTFEGKEWEDNVLMNVNFPVKKQGVTPEIRAAWPKERGSNLWSFSTISFDKPRTVLKSNPCGILIFSIFLKRLTSSNCLWIKPAYLTLISIWTIAMTWLRR